MHILIVGATGRTGQAVLRQALAAGHDVTAFGRSAPPQTAGLTFVAGDPRKPDDLSAAMKGQDAVVSCLGQRSSADHDLLALAAKAILQAMTAADVRRLVVVSQGLLAKSVNPAVFALRVILKRHVADSRAMERLIGASPLDWTIVRPPRLIAKARTTAHQIVVDAQPKGVFSMSYSALGVCLLHIVQSPDFTRKTLGVG
jgi:putative NADH-flavin reductase